MTTEFDKIHAIALSLVMRTEIAVTDFSLAIEVLGFIQALEICELIIDYLVERGIDYAVFISEKEETILIHRKDIHVEQRKDTFKQMGWSTEKRGSQARKSKQSKKGFQSDTRPS